MIIKQLLNKAMIQYTYIVGCEQTGKGVVIDPGDETDAIIDMIKRLSLDITHIFNTHHHVDHTSGNRIIKEYTKAALVIHKKEHASLKRFINVCKVGLMNFTSSPAADVLIEHDDEITVGTLVFNVIHTPGHTPGGLCFYANGNLFTGDTLFVGDSGRTDLPGGSRKELGASIRKLMKLFPDETVVWPGHDYGPTPTSTLGWEKKHNVNAVEYGYYSG